MKKTASTGAAKEKAKVAKPEKIVPPASDVELEVGQTAPEFSLESDAGDTVSLAKLRGRKVVLYFYPKDSTPGCTTEAQDFTRLLPQFEKRDTVVLGVSTDSLASHARFREKCSLGVTLLSDPEAATARAYGVWREKSLYGRKFIGMVRSTFLIDEEGRIAVMWPKVKVAGHAEDVLSRV